jgi:hypothetical protein
MIPPENLFASQRGQKAYHLFAQRRIISRAGLNALVVAFTDHRAADPSNKSDWSWRQHHPKEDD